MDHLEARLGELTESKKVRCPGSGRLSPASAGARRTHCPTCRRLVGARHGTGGWDAVVSSHSRTVPALSREEAVAQVLDECLSHRALADVLGVALDAGTPRELLARVLADSAATERGLAVADEVLA